MTATAIKKNEMAGVGIGVGFSYFFLYLTLSLRVWWGGGLGRGIFLNFLYTFNFFTSDLYTFAILPIYFFAPSYVRPFFQSDHP